MKICAVQFQPHAGDIEANTIEHVRYIDLAAAHRADLIFFPELSLTGYEPTSAKALATTKTDPRLDVFQECSTSMRLIIGIGLPVRVADGIRIGMVWFTPDAPRREYAKQQLHDDELPFFV